MSEASYISDRAMRLLKRIDACVEYDRELVKEGGKWYLGSTRIDPKVIEELQFLCLIRGGKSPGESYERWTISHDGQEILKDPGYVPRIVEVIRNGKEKQGHRRRTHARGRFRRHDSE